MKFKPFSLAFVLICFIISSCSDNSVSVQTGELHIIENISGYPAGSIFNYTIKQYNSRRQIIADSIATGQVGPDSTFAVALGIMNESQLAPISEFDLGIDDSVTKCAAFSTVSLLSSDNVESSITKSNTNLSLSREGDFKEVYIYLETAKIYNEETIKISGAVTNKIILNLNFERGWNKFAYMLVTKRPNYREYKLTSHIPSGGKWIYHP